MHDAIKDRVKELLSTGQIDGFLALKNENGHIKPHLFVSSEEVDHLSIGDHLKAGDTRYPLTKILTRLLCEHPEDRIGILVRGCDQRALKALAAWNQIALEQVVPIGVACPEELAQACGCAQPYPDEWIEGEKVEPRDPRPADWEGKSRLERLRDWSKEFEKCIKCYGCRNACPMCFCKECSLESDDVVPKGEIPPQFPMFHLVRAVHMIGRCVDCGMCEEACPANIPLRSLYKKVNDIVETRFKCRTGVEQIKPSPLHRIEEPPPAVEF
ncbi:MAG: 4Fe-4S ferredoxin [Syntrophobacteria bacterium]